MANLTIELSEHEVMLALRDGVDCPDGYEVKEVQWKFGSKPYDVPYDPRESNSVPCLNGATIVLQKKDYYR